MRRILISFGHGYSATALSDLLVTQGWRVYGTTRSKETADKLRTRGVEPLIWGDQDAIVAALESADHLLSSVAPDGEGDPVLRAFGPQITRRAGDLRWIGYLSTTGVYGDHAGGWINEDTPLAPSTERGKARVLAEAAWHNATNARVQIFRLAGIYGPGRGPFAKVRNGTARRIIKDNQVFSRIHVADIARVLQASMNEPAPGGVYNVCDDDPAPPQDVIGYAAELLNMPLPPATPYEDADMTPMARSFYAESKRVSNKRIKSKLGVVLQYPDYRSGLRALLRQENP